MIRQAICAVSFIATLGFAGWSIRGQETIINNGETVYLSLAPIDPRSLLQGDYMVLNYALNRTDVGEWKQKVFYIKLDEQSIAAEAQWLPESENLGEGWRAFPADKHQNRTRIPPDSYLFEDGKAEVYEAARFAQFSLLTDGRAALVALTDDELEPLDSFRAPLKR